MAVPSAQEILAFLAKASTPLTKNEMARAFNVKNDDRNQFKQLLRDMVRDGALQKHPGGAIGLADGLPEVGIVEVTDITIDGEVYARPAQWDPNKGESPRILMTGDRKGHPAMTKGDRALARLSKRDGGNTGRTIRRLDEPENKILGEVQRDGKGFMLIPSNKKNRNVYSITADDLNGAKVGEIVIAEVQPTRGARSAAVRVSKIIGHMSDPKAISLIAVHEMGLRTEFSAAVIAETDNMEVPGLKGREDMRHIPLLTIDPADARDRDDAVYVYPDKTPEGLTHAVVAIADVSHYVKAGSALDKEAFARGNSTYLPDMVIPMLPEKLSNGLCSLAPNENRACIAVDLYFDDQGNLQKYKFKRGLMRSVAALSYEQAQAAMVDGVTDDVTGPLLDPILKPLFALYKTLRAARDRRGALDLSMPERRIVMDENNKMVGVKIRPHFEAHEVIEELMVNANVAAGLAEQSIYRVHDKPNAMKMETLAEYLQAFGVSMPKAAVPKPRDLNQILKQVADHPYKHLVNEAMLRSMAQAVYSPDDIGHYGLALEKGYAHFTSPIRRYSDLVKHRGLIAVFNLGKDGLRDEDRRNLAEVAEHISATERTSVQAERNAVDRFTAAYLSEQIGAQFAGRIRGVTANGLFVSLSDTGADGFVPLRMLPRDQYHHDESRHALIGRHSGRIFRLGAQVMATVVDAERVSGNTILELVGAENGADIPGADFGDAGMGAGAYEQRGHRRGNGHGGRGKHRGDRGGPRR
jgi:ribonuclease R